ncbi:MAG: DUF1343 domain-containing protein [Candidatus Sumerlaeia bacterium]|nr:DUF1343 domain-containing protein [Candidatus Sumerlaeia bacterium]
MSRQIRSSKNARFCSRMMSIAALMLLVGCTTRNAGTTDSGLLETESIPLSKLDTRVSVVSLSEEVQNKMDPEQRFSLGLDQFVREDFRELDHRRVGVVTSRLALDSSGRHLLESLLPQRNPLVRRVIIFDDELAASARGNRMDSILSKYPEVRTFGRSSTGMELTEVMLGDCDVVVVDLPWRGTGNNPELHFFFGVMRHCLKHGLPVIVLDRPNPFGDAVISGPPQNAMSFPQGDFQPISPTAGNHPFTVPFLSGMSLGEIATQMNREYGFGLNLRVVPVSKPVAGGGLGSWYELNKMNAEAVRGEFEEWPQYFPTDPANASALLLTWLIPELSWNGEEIVWSGVSTDQNHNQQVESVLKKADFLPVGAAGENGSWKFTRETNLGFNAVEIAFHWAILQRPRDEGKLLAELCRKVSFSPLEQLPDDFQWAVVEERFKAQLADYRLAVETSNRYKTSP